MASGDAHIRPADDLASEGASDAASRPEGRGRTVRMGAAVLALVAVFLTFGLPRFLNHDAGPVGAHTEATFGKLCRDHGGTPAKPPATGTADPRVCTVRYGGRVYRMDAITPTGFDQDTARFQRQGCELAARQAKATGHRGPTFVYHPVTGVCEHRT